MYATDNTVLVDVTPQVLHAQAHLCAAFPHAGSNKAKCLAPASAYPVVDAHKALCKHCLPSAGKSKVRITFWAAASKPDQCPRTAHVIYVCRHS